MRNHATRRRAIGGRAIARRARNNSHTAPESLTPAAMYAAICRRDASFQGQFLVGVRTTGVFCRPGCPARAPARQNCAFYASPGAALAAGLRPCRRCRPLDAPPAAPPWALRLIERLQRAPDAATDPHEIRALGVHPATASRYFKSHMGSTLQSLSRARRAGLALGALRKGSKMLEAVRVSGFDSESGLRKAFDDLWQDSPARVVAGDRTPLVACWLSTPLGALLAAAVDEGLCILEFVDGRRRDRNLRQTCRRMGRPITAGAHPHLAQVERELHEFFAGARRGFDTPLCTVGTPFQERVWSALRRIPCGQTRSYAAIARQIGAPTAVRAVAAANAANPLAIVVPCHRVVGADGRLTGYGGGLWRKRRLLELESIGI